jgi:putative ABC transport system permease protein
MEEIFGMPVNQFMVALLLIFGVGVVIIGVVALRNRVILKLAARNIPRRRAQTALIVLGLMLATLLFSASFTTGDTLTKSVRSQALSWIGEVDVVVMAETRDASGGLAYFDESHFDAVQDRLLNDPDVEGVAPLIHVERAPMISLDTGLNEPQVHVLGYREESMGEFDRLVDGQGKTLPLTELDSDQIYISAELADSLEVSSGDTIQTFLGSEAITLEVAGIYEQGANPTAALEETNLNEDLSIAMPLTQLQELTGNDGLINSILITHRGGEIEGAQYTKATIGNLEPLLEQLSLEANPLKQDALDTADEVGSVFFTIFFVLGGFSIAAGVLLIFLLFVMLAAERKRELGIARAVGTQRSHIIRMFTFEGAIYALIAAAVGSLLGVAVGWGMVRIMGAAFAGFDFELSFAFSLRSIVIAYTLGMVLTFIVVLVSSWRVSRLNIVRAIRDIPEPRIDRKSRRGLIVAILVPIIGLFLAVAGIGGEQLAAWMMGISLIIIGLPLLARRFGIPDRPAFTIAGLGLVVWWLLPEDVLGSVLPEMVQGMEMFFISGIMMVIGAVWLTIYNSDLLLAAAVALFGRIRGLAPVIKTAFSYPMQNRFRTGMALAMFSLVIFTIVVMSFMNNAFTKVIEDTERITGGYHIQANTSYANPIRDIEAELAQSDGVTLDDFEAIASFTYAQANVKQRDTEQEPTEIVIQGANAGYTDEVTFKFTIVAEDFNLESPREVWKALQTQPGTAIVSSDLVPTKSNYNLGGVAPDFTLEGFWLEDGEFPGDIYIQAQNPLTEKEQSLRVIGVLEQSASFGGGGVIMGSQETVNSIVEMPQLPQVYLFRLAEGVDAEATAKALKVSFLENGMQAEVLEEQIREATGISQVFNNLLQGFMGLGLVVGIAALGVIAARSVVERRQHIGILRAIGFQKGRVRLSFLLESSFIALLGIALGVGLGMALSYNLINAVADDIEGMKYAIPWVNIVIVVVIAYGASLLTTFLPARQASNVYPAEALRYE